MKKRLIAIILAVVMIISVFSLSAYARQPERPIYVALGDSITAGFGLPTYDYDTFLQAELHIKDFPDDCYVKKVGDALGADTYNLAIPGFDASALRYTLNGRDIVNDPTCNFWFRDTMLETLPEGYSYVDLFLGDTPSAEALRNADYITVNIGANNLLKMMTGQMVQLEGFDFEQVTGMAILGSFGDNKNMIVSNVLSDIFNQIKENGIKPEDISSFFNSFMKLLNPQNLNSIFAEVIDEVKTDYEEIVKRLREINPTAQINLVGFFNYYDLSPFQGQSALMSLSKLLGRIVGDVNKFYTSSDMPIESIISADDAKELNNVIYTVVASVLYYYCNDLMENLNAYLQQKVSQIDDAVYTDVSNIPYNPSLDPHPLSNGHSYIGNQVISAISGITIRKPENINFFVPAVVPVNPTKIHNNTNPSVKTVPEIMYKFKNAGMRDISLQPDFFGNYTFDMYLNDSFDIGFNRFPLSKTWTTGFLSGVHGNDLLKDFFYKDILFKYINI